MPTTNGIDFLDQMRHLKYLIKIHKIKNKKYAYLKSVIKKINVCVGQWDKRSLTKL